MMFFKRDIPQELDKLHQQEITITAKVVEVDRQLNGLENPEIEDFESASREAISLQSEKDTYTRTLTAIGKKRVALIKELYSDRQNARNERVTELENEIIDIEAKIEKLAEKLGDAKRSLEDRKAELLQTVGIRETVSGPYPITKLRQIIDSPECPMVDRLRIRKLLQDYDTWRSNHPDALLISEVHVNADGVITRVVNDPTGIKVNEYSDGVSKVIELEAGVKY